MDGAFHCRLLKCHSLFFIFFIFYSYWFKVYKEAMDGGTHCRLPRMPLWLCLSVPLSARFQCNQPSYPTHQITCDTSHPSLLIRNSLQLKLASKTKLSFSSARELFCFNLMETWRNIVQYWSQVQTEKMTLWNRQKWLWKVRGNCF